MLLRRVLLSGPEEDYPGVRIVEGVTLGSNGSIPAFLDADPIV